LDASAASPNLSFKHRKGTKMPRTRFILRNWKRLRVEAEQIKTPQKPANDDTYSDAETPTHAKAALPKAA
jgi:hypothetical protein